MTIIIHHMTRDLEKVDLGREIKVKQKYLKTKKRGEKEREFGRFPMFPPTQLSPCPWVL